MVAAVTPNSSKAALQPSRLGQEKAVLLFARGKVMKRNALGAPFPRVTLGLKEKDNTHTVFA